jgi:hypothetical protein
MENFEELKQLILSIEEDVVKFYEKENKAAGVRLRKGLQEIRITAQNLRLDVSEKNKTRKTR